MEVTFSTSKLQKICNSGRKLRGAYGPRMASLIEQRLMELADALVLEDMRHVVGANCHELHGNLDGYLAVSLVYPDRLVFRPAHNPVPLKPDGGVDWSLVTRIEVIGIGDYHGK